MRDALAYQLAKEGRLSRKVEELNDLWYAYSGRFSRGRQDVRGQRHWPKKLPIRALEATAAKLGSSVVQ